jgi:hypothetical protein
VTRPDRNAARPLRAHLVGSIPLPDAASVFRSLAEQLGPHLARMPDGETGIRRSWIRFLQDALAAHPAIEIATDLPPFRFVQWDGQLVREIPRLRLRKHGASVSSEGFATGYADMAIASFEVFESLQAAGVVPAAVKFQVCLPTPIAPTYNNIVPTDRPPVLAALTQHFAAEVAKIAASLPPERVAIQWDVCQEVLAWEGYYEPGPVDFRTETLDTLTAIGAAVPEPIELGYHLCYGSPLDEHLVQPRDTRIMVEIINEVTARVPRSIQYFHLPVPKTRVDDAYFAPLDELALRDGTELYLGLIHYADAAGDAARLAAARRHARVAGVGTECGMGRGDPRRLETLLEAHAALVRSTHAGPG